VLFIQLFWLEQRFRSKGFGAKLIEAIEDEARRFGATQSYVDTIELPGAGLLPRQRI
jgi:GNAT superfamily N-acetyltransferase